MTSTTDAPLVLVVEDDVALRTRLVRAFTARGFDVREAADPALAMTLAREDPPEFVVLDLRMGEASGLDLIPGLVAIEPAMRIVVLTGYGSIATAIEAMRRGAHHYLTKPATVDEIVAAFERSPAGAATPAVQPMSLDRVEWEHINRVLVDCGGNVSEAARQLGLHRRSLQRKLGKHPVPR